jgi:hypothetical protein
MTTPVSVRLGLLLGFMLSSASLVRAEGILSSSQGFAVLGASAVTNTGLSTVHGDLGVWPTPTITGLGDITLTGSVHNGDAVAQQAQVDAFNAYAFLTTQGLATDLSGTDLGTIGTLLPGVYSFTSSAQLTGTLTLDAQGDSNALFIFQIGSTLTTASSSAVNVLNAGPNTGVFWQVGSSATLGTSTVFAGNILAAQSITLTTSATITCGRAFALNGAVTMDTNTISNDCTVSDGGGSRDDFGSLGFAAAGPAEAVPEPGTFALFGLCILGVCVSKWAGLIPKAKPVAVDSTR